MFSDFDMFIGDAGEMYCAWGEKGAEQITWRRKFAKFVYVVCRTSDWLVVTVGSELRAADDQIGVGLAFPLSIVMIRISRLM